MDPITLSLVAAASLASSGLQVAQGFAAKQQADQLVDAEREAGKSEELQRLRKLRYVQASVRAAAAGAGGDIHSGSVIAQEEDNAQAARIAQFNSDYARRVRAAQLRARGRNAVTEGAIGGGVELMSGAASFFDLRSRMTPKTQASA